MAKITKTYWGISRNFSCGTDQKNSPYNWIKLGCQWILFESNALGTEAGPILFERKKDATEYADEDGETPIELRVTIEDV